MAFKIGDKVRVKDSFGEICGGDKEPDTRIGTVVEVYDAVCLEFKNWTGGHAGPYEDARTSCWYFDYEDCERTAKRGKKPAKATQEYLGNGKHTWERVTSTSGVFEPVWRLRVPGGWLYGQESDTSTDTFVPMPDVVKHKV